MSLAKIICPICGPIFEEIAGAKTFNELTGIRLRMVTHAIGITEEQRGELLAAIEAKEDALLAFHLPAYSLEDLKRAGNGNHGTNGTDEKLDRHNCPQCGRTLVYDDDRDDEGNVLQAWYRCDSCERSFSFQGKRAETVLGAPANDVLPPVELAGEPPALL